MNPAKRILVVRLGAMGDIVCALPAVACLRRAFPGAEICWAAEPKWLALVEGNPCVDRAIAIERRTFNGIRAAWRDLRRTPFDFVVDFQGLIKSAVVASVARSPRVFGFAPADARERAAGWFYSDCVRPALPHAVERALALAAAAGAVTDEIEFPLPPGRPEGNLPATPFVMASPLAGWGSKQWPLENYAALGELLERECGLPLVLNGAAAIVLPHTLPHVSSVAGLIDATRRAAAVVGLDSGPLHLAAALGKPGVALFGPTDPARNGPWGDTIAVLRGTGAVTTYKRRAEPGAGMRAIAPGMVFEALKRRLAGVGAGATARP